MKKEEFTSHHLRNILELYKQYLGGSEIDNYLKDNSPSRGLKSRIDKLIDELNKNNYINDRRIGSKYTIATKLGFFIDREGYVYPEVNLNFDPKRRNGPKYEKAQESATNFLAKSMNYLKNQE